MHKVIFSDNIITELLSLKEGFSRSCILVDENTRAHCLPLLGDIFSADEVIEVRSGEEGKNIATCQEIWEAMTRLGLDRKSIVVNLGGGVIGDMGGFCASVYKRGIAFVQIPTTLLAQVDASVGGKVGVDFMDYKNQLGSFSEPVATIIDVKFLKTLEERQIQSGFAEVLKHYLIADGDSWREVVQAGLPDWLSANWSETVEKSVKIKQDIVARDPFEGGERKKLNFGHTVGHAVESYFLSDKKRYLLHGEAIAVGMICETYLSCRFGLIVDTELQEIARYLRSTYPGINVLGSEVDAIAQLTLQDKKNIGGEISCILLSSVGNCRFDMFVSMDDIRESLEYYRGLEVTDEK